MSDITDVWDTRGIGAEVQVFNEEVTGDNWVYCDPMDVSKIHCDCFLFVAKAVDVPDVSWRVQGSPLNADEWQDDNGIRNIVGSGNLDKYLTEKPWPRLRVGYKSRFSGQVSKISVWVSTK